MTGAFQGRLGEQVIYYRGFLQISPDRSTLYYADGGVSPSTLIRFDVYTGAGVLRQPGRGGFMVSRVGGLELPVTVSCHNGGSAVRDGDYAAFPGSVTIPARQTETGRSRRS